MRMEQLRCLVDISKTKSITATAQNLFMTHQAVSQRIKQLESDLGVELLVRTNTGVRITEIGERVLTYAQQILSMEKTIEQLCKAQILSSSTDDVVIRILSDSPVLNLILSDISVVFDPLPYKIILKIDMVDSAEVVLAGIENNQYHIGLVTCHSKQLQRLQAQLESSLQVELLSSDHLVAVSKQKLCKNSQDYFPAEICQNHLRTGYNIIPMDENIERAERELVSRSPDADFHRRMIDRKSAVVIMPGLAYQYSFNAKKYVGLPLESVPDQFAHAAIYRKDNHERTNEFVAMMRREIQLNRQ